MDEHTAPTEGIATVAEGTLRFDSAGLHSLWSDLRAVESEFDHAEKRSGAAVDAVGHAGLADRIR